MIRKLGILLMLVMAYCANALADQEFDIFIGSKEEETVTRNIEFGEFEIAVARIPNTHKYDVTIGIKNTTRNEAILVFKYDYTEKELKKQRPKKKIAKNFPGNRREVKESKFVNISASGAPILPGTGTTTIARFMIESGGEELQLPVYLASYDQKKEAKKGVNNVDFEIFRQFEFKFNIIANPWTREDPTYVQYSNAVNALINKVNNKTICTNSKHGQTVQEQKEPYLTERDSLIKKIEDVIKGHPEWTVGGEQVQAYNELLQKLNSIQFKEGDCGNHTGPTPDDTYKQLSKSVNKLIKNVNNTTICTNSKHEKSVEKQKEQYLKERDNLIAKIQNEIKRHPERSNDYNALINKLNNIRFKNGDCGKHVPNSGGGQKGKIDDNPGGTSTKDEGEHTCKYDSYSAERIYQELDKIDQKLDKGTISKSQGKSQANALYKCYLENNDRKIDSKIRRKIEECYKSINGK